MRPTILAAALLALCSPALAAECTGTNLFDTMPADRAAAIEAATRDVPYRRGLLFLARKGDQQITLAGTYHFGDPRHQAMVDRLRPVLADAGALLVEAAPADEARLARALSDDPTLMVDQSGRTLPERLSQDEWRRLSRAMSDRGTPAVITARMRPWYVAMMLGISPCMVRIMAEDGDKAAGLDRLVVAEAQAARIPVQSLEPWDTIFDLFADLTPAQELDMIRAALPAAGHADDYAVTLTDAYFQGDVWKIWEFGRFDAYANSGLTRAQVDAQMDLAQTRLMDNRNRAWIVPLTRAARDAAADGQGIVAAFGALHLPGTTGVLSLLEAEGYEVRRLD